MNLEQILSCFALAAAAGLLPFTSAPSQAQSAAVAIDNDDIGGVVRGPTGRRPASG